MYQLHCVHGCSKSMFTQGIEDTLKAKLLFFSMKWMSIHFHVFIFLYLISFAGFRQILSHFKVFVFRTETLSPYVFLRICCIYFSSFLYHPKKNLNYLCNVSSCLHTKVLFVEGGFTIMKKGERRVNNGWTYFLCEP